MQPLTEFLSKENITKFIQLVPKTDLHLHLDGSLRLGTLIEIAKADKVHLPSYSEAGLKETVFKEKYNNLPEYLQGFAYTCAVMHKPENIERISYELAVDNIAENVRYIEVRFAPQLLIDGVSMKQIVQAVNRGLQRAQDEHNRSAAVLAEKDIPFHYGIILCAMRYFNEHMAPYYAKLINSLPYTPRKELYAFASLELARSLESMVHEDGIPIVGFDLAGPEAGYPAIDHKAAYQYAHSCFVKKTVHAGEAYGPESIFQAITECYANRIGHGTFLFAHDMINNKDIKEPHVFVNNLVEYIASQRIAIEVCPTSNLQTVPQLNGDIAKHPLREMLQRNLSISICTDNRLVSETTITQEYLKVIENLPINRHDLRNLVIAGFKGSFFPGSYNEKRAYVRKVLDRYDNLEKELLAQK